MNDRLTRRAVLRGLGVTMALPWMESLGVAAERAIAFAGGAAEPEAPVRLAFVFLPNGVNYESWRPRVGATEVEFELSPTLESLAPVREHINIFTGLTLKKARANGDGPGDHARSSASFLTGSQARKTAGNDIHIGISID